MRHAALLIVLASCWSSTPDPVAPSPPRPQRQPIATTVEPAKCRAFDPADPACKTVCPRVDPGDWPACIAEVETLVAEGFACAGSHPRTCVRPAPVPIPPCPAGGCVPVTARVIAIRVVGAHLEVTISVGAHHGVTTAWRAKLLDGRRQAVPQMDVQLTRVDPNVSRGTITATADQLRSTPYVLLEP